MIENACIIIIVVVVIIVRRRRHHHHHHHILSTVSSSSFRVLYNSLHIASGLTTLAVTNIRNHGCQR